MGVVVRRYIDFLIILLLIPTPLVSALFCSSILLFVHFLYYGLYASYAVYASYVGNIIPHDST